MDASKVQMLEYTHKVAEVRRGFSKKLFDALRQRYEVAHNKLADVSPYGLKRATYFVVATFPVLSVIAFLASYMTVYATRVEQGGLYIKWSLNCSASSAEGTIRRWTLQCSREPIPALHAVELIRGALGDAKNRSFIDGECVTDQKRIPSRDLGDYSVQCDLLDAYESAQAEGKTIFFILAIWLVFRVINTHHFPDLYDESILTLTAAAIPLVRLSLSHDALCVVLFAVVLVDWLVPLVCLYW